MADLVARYPDVHVTFNFSPVLLWQIEDYVDRGAVDRAWLASLRPSLESLESFFDADSHHQIYPHPRYRELLERRVRGLPFTSQDLTDLAMWFNLAWCAPELRTDSVLLPDGREASVRRFVERGRDFHRDDGGRAGHSPARDGRRASAPSEPSAARADRGRCLPERDDRKILAFDLQRGKVGKSIAAQEGRAESPPVAERDLDVRRAFDDVIVREDISALVEDETGTESSADDLAVELVLFDSARDDADDGRQHVCDHRGKSGAHRHRVSRRVIASRRRDGGDRHRQDHDRSAPRDRGSHVAESFHWSAAKSRHVFRLL
jgi:hypothetical protein